MTAAPTPQRIQLKRSKGWKMPPNTIKVDRTTPWGNPFIVGVHGTRERCVQLFTYMLSGWICLGTKNADAQGAYLTMARANLHRLRGKNLACWCPPGAKCHADVLLEAANDTPINPCSSPPTNSAS